MSLIHIEVYIDHLCCLYHHQTHTGWQLLVSNTNFHTQHGCQYNVNSLLVKEEHQGTKQHIHKNNTAFPFTSLKCPQVFWQSIVSSSSSDTYCSLRVNDFKMCYLWYNMRSGGHLLESHMATLTSLHWAYVISQFDWEQSGEKPAHECASQHCRNLLSLHWHPAQMEMDNWWGYNHHHFFLVH